MATVILLKSRIYKKTSKIQNTLPSNKIKFIIANKISIITLH